MRRRKKLDCKVSITRSQGHQEHNPITIRITDTTSGVEFLEVTMSPQTFASAVTGLSLQPAEMEVGFLEVLGCKREVQPKEVAVPSGLYGEERMIAAKEAIKEFEKDGWEGRSQDADNARNRLQNHGKGEAYDVFRITFIRFVDSEGKPVVRNPT